MLTRTIRSAKVMLTLFIAFTLTATANAASGQNDHHTFKVDAAMLDSTDLQHLQVSLRRMDSVHMKFRLSAFNPASRFMNITIKKGDDVYFQTNIRQDVYDYVFDLSSLEDGSYQLIVNNGKEKFTKDIDIATATHVDRELSVH